MSVTLPNETKETLMSILERAASQDRSVIEFTKDEGELHAADITEHVANLEDQIEVEEAHKST